MYQIQLISFFSLLSSFFLCNTAIQALQSENIQGGLEIKSNVYKYNAIVMIGTSLCGGAIIHQQNVVTAAHCIYHTNKTLRQGPIRIVAGVTDLNSEVKVQRDIDQISYHKSFTYYFTGHVLYDIAVLRLTIPLDLGPGSRLSKLHLPRIETFMEQKVHFTGFGVNRIIGRFTNRGYEVFSLYKTDNLHYASGNILSADECRKTYSILPDEYAPTFICAQMDQYSTESPTGICNGDSGGPLVYKGRILVGIASAALVDCDETNFGAVYTNVFHFRNLIDKAIKNECDLESMLCEPYPPMGSNSH